MWTALICIGNHYELTNDVENAISTYSSAIEVDDKNAKLHFYLAKLYERDSRAEQAEHHVIKSLELDHENPTYLRAAVDILNQRGKQSKALTYLKELHKLNPEDHYIVDEIADQFFNLQAFQEAIQWYKQSIGANPDNRRSRRRIEIIQQMLDA